jgi:hypothetical protein
MTLGTPPRSGPPAARALRMIGLWHDAGTNDGWPDVRAFVDPAADPRHQEITVSYLRSGTVFVATAGFSLCRICGTRNGSAELTDGEHFVWPEGLPHYIEAHAVRLPEEVLEIATLGPPRNADPAAIEHALLETGELTITDKWGRTLTHP